MKVDEKVGRVGVEVGEKVGEVREVGVEIVQGDG